METIDEFYAQAGKYAGLLDDFAQKHSLEGIAKADHICYKCDSAASFERMRALFEDESEYVYQSIISKRRIACIKFKKGIKTSIGDIFYLELSDQKPDGSQNNRFDHIEIYPVDFVYNSLVEKLKKEGETIVEEVRPHHMTHDIDIGEDFFVKLAREPLIEKIKRTEIN